MEANNFNIPYAMADDPYVQPFRYVGGRPQFQPQPFYPILPYSMQPPYYILDTSDPDHPYMYGSSTTLVDVQVAPIADQPRPTYTVGYVQDLGDGVELVNLVPSNVRDHYEYFEFNGELQHNMQASLFENIIDEQMGGVVSYEDLLEMEERVGRVNVGLSEETISKHLKTTTSRVDHGHYNSNKEEEEGAEICVVCQYEYKGNDETVIIGILHCGHRYHADCIKEWLLQHNVCPICKSTALQV